MIVDSSFNLAVHALVCLSHSGRSHSSEAQMDALVAELCAE